jgi:hypothetical protein
MDRNAKIRALIQCMDGIEAGAGRSAGKRREFLSELGAR